MPVPIPEPRRSRLSDIGPNPVPLEVQELILERLKVASRVNIGRQLLEDAELHTMWDIASDTLAVQLSTFLMSHQVAEDHARALVEHPATWWDHLKRDLAVWAVPFHPGRRRQPLKRLVSWWLRRHPVRVTAYTVNLRVRDLATFPENDQVYPKSMGTVRMIRQADAWASREYPDGD